MSAVAAEKSVDWFTSALEAVEEIAKANRTFTTDDIWRLVEETQEPRVMGAVMRQAEANGLCSPSGGYRKSLRQQCHGRPVRVWRSRVTA